MPATPNVFSGIGRKDRVDHGRFGDMANFALEVEVLLTAIMVTMVLLGRLAVRLTCSHVV
ncbi:MAG: hypothetical protein ACR2GH_14885 [Pseudonocardia sp.]